MEINGTVVRKSLPVWYECEGRIVAALQWHLLNKLADGSVRVSASLRPCCLKDFLLVVDTEEANIVVSWFLFGFETFRIRSEELLLYCQRIYAPKQV